MRVPELHERLLRDALAAGARYGLVLAGGYAVQAHGLVSRPSQDLDFATEHPAAMDEMVAHLAAALQTAGWAVKTIDVTPVRARLLVTAPATGEACEVDLLKEVMWRPPVQLELGPVLARDDLVGTKIRALADRGLPRDVIDAHAASELYALVELEQLGARHTDDFDLQELHDRLEAVQWVHEREFTALGVLAESVDVLRAWAVGWADDIAARLVEPYTDEG